MIITTTGYKPFSGLFIYLSVCPSTFALVGQYFFCYMEYIHRLTWKCTILNAVSIYIHNDFIQTTHIQYK
jgi:hypothetical protein